VHSAKSRCASSACRTTSQSHGEPGQLVGRAARRGPEPRATKQTLTSLPRVCRCSSTCAHLVLQVVLACEPVLVLSSDQLLVKFPGAQAVPRRPIGADQGLGALGQRFCSGVLAPGRSVVDPRPYHCLGAFNNISPLCALHRHRQRYEPQDAHSKAGEVAGPSLLRSERWSSRRRITCTARRPGSTCLRW
jgi:hypothetical protein